MRRLYQKIASVLLSAAAMLYSGNSMTAIAGESDNQRVPYAAPKTYYSLRQG